MLPGAPFTLPRHISLDPAPADCIAAHPSSVSAFLLGSLSQPLRPFSFQHWSSLMSSLSIRAGLTRLLSFLHSRADHPCAFRRLSLKTSIIFRYPCNPQCFYLEGKHCHGAQRSRSDHSDLLSSSFPTKELKTSIIFFPVI